VLPGHYGSIGTPHLYGVKGDMMRTMQSFPLGRVVLTWVCFVPMAVLNGVIREKVYRPMMGELRAHQISTALASTAFLSWALFMFKKQVALLDRKRLLLMGLSWVSLTMLFEFGFGHYIAKTPWKKLVHDYNLLKGRVWSLFLLTELLSPLLLKWVKNRRSCPEKGNKQSSESHPTLSASHYPMVSD
jgi:hypothetical protein